MRSNNDQSGRRWLWLCAVLLGMGLPVRGQSTRLLLSLPPIQGSSVISGYQGWIEPTSYQWGQAKESPPIGGGAGGPANFSDVVFTKVQDAASSNLLYYCSHGLVITQASFITAIFGPHVGKSNLLSRLDIQNVYVSGVNVSVGGGGVATETVSLHFRDRFIWSYAHFTNSALAGQVYVGGYSSFWNVSNKVGDALVPFTVKGVRGGSNGVTVISWPAAKTAVYDISRATGPSGPFLPYSRVTNDLVSTNLTLNITNVGTTMYFYQVQGQF